MEHTAAGAGAMVDGGGSDPFPEVSIIVLNWNGFEDTVECIGSLKKQIYPNYKIVIVDNGSTDGSEELLKKEFPELTIIQTGANSGYAGGMNAGIRHVLASRAEYTILLNNDTTVAPDFAVELVKAAREEKTAGLLSSKIYFYDRPEVLWYAGASFNTLLGWGRHRGYDQLDDGRFDAVEETQRACGCSMMVTREFCERVGLLNEEFFCYFEDVDWGLRATKNGFKVLYVPASRVWHKGFKSTGGASTSISLYYNIRNTLKSLKTNSPLPVVIGQIRLVLIVLINIFSLFTMRIPKFLGMKRIWQGVRDYLSGRFGEFSP